MTLKQFNELTPGVFKAVIMKTDIVTGTLEDLLFVAVKGHEGGNDWTVYVTRPRFNMNLAANIDFCEQSGDKVMTKTLILEIVPCEEDLLKICENLY